LLFLTGLIWCGWVLIDKDWERIQETSDGGVRVDSHPVYVCPESTCGYMKRSEPIPKILPYDPNIPRIEIDDLELVYVETLQDVINLLAGQQLFPLLPEVEMIEGPKI
jgi:hypothetical protein